MMNDVGYDTNNEYLCIRMKKFCQYPIVVFMAALIFYGGSGINVASFCCDDCRSAGIEGIAEGVCCEIHGHEHEDRNIAESNMDYIGDAHEMNCLFVHIMYDWNFSGSSFFIPEPVTYDLLAIDLPDRLAISSPFLHDKPFENSTGPPFLCHRTYLSLLTTLLI
jgi:hypothetical protein